MTEITHERCSELLGGYQRGELAAGESSAVEQHLAGCAECRAELAGLRALVAADFEPMSDDERHRLRDAVAEQARAERATVHVLPAKRSFWERHAGQFVGAAASIVVILFAYLVFANGQGTTGDDSAGGEGDGAQTAEASPEALEDRDEGPQPVFAAPELRAGQESDEAQADQAGARAKALALQSRANFTSPSIQRLGESGPVFRRFTQAYSADDVPDLAPIFLEQLAAAAPEREQTEQILECGTDLFLQAPGRPLLPAYATVAEFDGEESLIIGFVDTDGTSTQLSRYSIWVWPVGDCRAPPSSRSGDIKPRP